MNTVLITGAGSGFGLEAAMRLAEKGFSVIAAVEIYGQVQPLSVPRRHGAFTFRWRSSTSPTKAIEARR